MHEISPNSNTGQVPYWRLSGFYFFYFASLGGFLPYWSLYLKSLDFDPRQIGELMAIVMATKIVAPNIWGWIADHTGRRMSIVRLGCLAATVTFFGMFMGHSYFWIALVMLVFSFFWNAALPQFEATTFNYLGDQTHRYSSIRLWGSVGFIITVAGIGPLLDYFQPTLLPYILVIFYLGIWLLSLTVPERAAGHLAISDKSLFDILRRPAVAILLLVCFLMQASHGPYYTFYTIYMEEHAYSKGFIGLLWALGVLAEVAVFMVMHKWVPRFGLKPLLLISLLLATVRWIAIGLFPQSLPLMLVAQSLHAASFGIYHAVAIHLVHIHFQGRHQGKGQALYSSLSFGAGGVVGSLYSGYLWHLGGGLTFIIAAAISAIAMIIAWFGIREPISETPKVVR